MYMEYAFMLIAAILMLGCIGALFVGDGTRFIIGFCLFILNGIVYTLIDNWESVKKFLDIPYMIPILFGVIVVYAVIVILIENKQIERMKKEHP